VEGDGAAVGRDREAAVEPAEVGELRLLAGREIEPVAREVEEVILQIMKDAATQA
jgi:hypothetical protein